MAAPPPLCRHRVIYSVKEVLVGCPDHTPMLQPAVNDLYSVYRATTLFLALGKAEGRWSSEMQCVDGGV